MWRSAAWRWSLMGGLVLHLGLGAAWWSARPEAPPVPTPMVVRLTSVAEHPAGRRPDLAPVAPAARPDREPPQPPAALPKTAQKAGAMPATTPRAREAAQVVPAVTATRPTNQTAVVRAAPAPAAAPLVAPAQAALPAPASNAAALPVAPAPAAPVPVTAVAAATGATSAMPAAPALTAPTATDARGQEPLEMDSTAIGYQVQPVLTFPDGEDLGEYGTVTLRVLVDEKGKAIEVKTLRSSGYARLDQHAIRVIRRARFVPKVHNGEPRKAWATVNLHFNAPKP